MGYVKSHARNAVQAFVDKDGPHPMSEMSSKFRRVRLASKVRSDLEMSLGRVPTADEIISTADKRFEGKSKSTNMLLSKDVLGWDAVGTVVETGPSVEGFTSGDRVYYAGAVNRQGTNAEYHLVDARIAAQDPATLRRPRCR